MKKMAVFVYGVVAYAVFSVSFLYAMGFVGNLLVPKGIDAGPVEPVGRALLINLLLLGAFAIQHSVMARPGFKRWWTRFIPLAMERSTYVLLASLLLLLLYWQWRPMTGIVWSVENLVGRLILQGFFGLGWGMVLLSTFMVNHFDLFGLRQVTRHALGKRYEPIGFKTPGLYRFLRHPIMLGFIIGFWATPRMTVGHLLFSVATTAYILMGIQLEERDLVTFFGEAYRRYRSEVPMLLPIRRRR